VGAQGRDLMKLCLTAVFEPHINFAFKSAKALPFIKVCSSLKRRVRKYTHIYKNTYQGSSSQITFFFVT